MSTLGDEIFPDAAEAFGWLNQYEGRKAEIALDMLRVAYTTNAKIKEDED